MDATNLSHRLQVVADLVPQGARLADIGSDHAYLPAALLLNDRIEFAVAGEVVKGPFENAKHEVNRHGLADRLIPRLADGLAAIEPADQIDTITICGMGGTLIKQIIAAHLDKLVGVKRLILQPNIGEPGLRAWLAAHHFEIMYETLVAEDDQIYEIIVAEPTLLPVRYNERELMFGPELIMHGGPVFTAKWQSERQRMQFALQQMQQAAQPPVDRIKDYQHKINLITEVIGDGEVTGNH